MQPLFPLNDRVIRFPSSLQRYRLLHLLHYPHGSSPVLRNQQPITSKREGFACICQGKSRAWPRQCQHDHSRDHDLSTGYYTPNLSRRLSRWDRGVRWSRVCRGSRLQAGSSSSRAGVNPVAANGGRQRTIRSVGSMPDQDAGRRPPRFRGNVRQQKTPQDFLRHLKHLSPAVLMVSACTGAWMLVVRLVTSVCCTMLDYRSPVSQRNLGHTCTARAPPIFEF